MGEDTKHWEGFGRIPPQGDPKAEGTTTAEGGLMGVVCTQLLDIDSIYPTSSVQTIYYTT